MKLVLFFAAILASASASAADRPWMGVQLDETGGVVRLDDVFATAPADRAGLLPGDEVVSLDGQPVRVTADFTTRVAAHAVGDTVRVVVRREGAEREIDVVLEARDTSHAARRARFLAAPAPAFALESYVGSYPAALEPGQVTLLMVFATWCPACKTASPRLSDWQRRYGQRGLRVIAVTTEDWNGVVRPFVDANPVAYTVASDPHGAVTVGLYRSVSYPSLFLVDRAGVVRRFETGTDELDEIEAAIQALLAEAPPAP